MVKNGPGVDWIRRPEAYGDSFADVYDEWYDGITDATATARFVAERAGTGPVLELGVGTGRLARPLRDRGLTVIGLDASAPMLAACVDPDRGPRLPVVRADMAALPFRARFGAVVLAFNTLFNLPSAEAQASLFRQLGLLLAPDGVLVVEVMDSDGLADGPVRSIGVSRRGDGQLTVVGTAVDRAEQTIRGQHVELTDTGIRRRPWFLRWSTEAEIDGFAAGAGLVAAERHTETTAVVTVYRPV